MLYSVSVGIEARFYCSSVVESLRKILEFTGYKYHLGTKVRKGRAISMYDEVGNRRFVGLSVRDVIEYSKKVLNLNVNIHKSQMKYALEFGNRAYFSTDILELFHNVVHNPVFNGSFSYTKRGRGGYVYEINGKKYLVSILGLSKLLQDICSELNIPSTLYYRGNILKNIGIMENGEKL